MHHGRRIGDLHHLVGRVHRRVGVEHLGAVGRETHGHDSVAVLLEDLALLEGADRLAGQQAAVECEIEIRPAVGLTRVVRIVLHLDQDVVVRRRPVFRQAEEGVGPAATQLRLNTEIVADHSTDDVIPVFPREHIRLAVPVPIGLVVADRVKEDGRLARPMILHDHRRRPLLVVYVHRARPAIGRVEAAADQATARPCIGWRNGVHLVLNPRVARRRAREPHALVRPEDIPLLVTPLQLDDGIRARTQWIIAVAAQIGTVRIATERNHRDILPHPRVAPHLDHVQTVILPAPAASHLDVAPCPIPLRHHRAALFKALVAQRVHLRPHHAAIGHLDLIAVLPNLGTIGVATRHTAHRAGCEIDLDRRPVPRHVLAAAHRSLKATYIRRVHAEEIADFAREGRALLAIEILQAGQVRHRQHVYALGNHHRPQEIQHRLVRRVRNHVLHAHVARENDYAIVGEDAGAQFVKIDEIRLVAESLQGAGHLLHFALVAVVLRIVRRRPQERYVRLRILRGRQQVVNFRLSHQIVRIAAHPVGRLDGAIRVDNTKTLLPVRDPRPVHPREYVRADRANFQRFPQRIPDQRALPVFVHPRPHRFGTGETRLRIHHGNLGDLLGEGDAPLAILRLMPENRPRIVVHGEEIERRVGGRAGRRNFAAILGVIPPVFFAPLHAHRGIRHQVVRVGHLRRPGASRSVARDGVFPPLHGIRPNRPFHAIGPILLGKRELVEVGIAGAPGRVGVCYGGVLALAPGTERLFAVGIIAVQQPAPQTQVAVLIAQDPPGNGLVGRIAAAHRREELGILRARRGSFVADDVGLPAVGVQDAFRIGLGRVHRVPGIRKPVRRPLVTHQREDSDVAFLAFLDKQVVVGPTPDVVALLLDVLPDEIHANAVRAHLDHLIQIIPELIRCLPHAQRTVPCLVRYAPRHPWLAGHRVIEIPVLQLDESRKRRLHGNHQHQHRQHAQHHAHCITHTRLPLDSASPVHSHRQHTAHQNVTHPGRRADAPPIQPGRKEE